jgi:hypothetical protein
MTPWQYAVAIAGWAKANGAGEKQERSYPSDEEFEDALVRLH